jgi:hypothetical protein
VRRELRALAAAVADLAVLVGFPERSGAQRHNAVAVLRDVAASSRCTASSACRITRCSTRTAISRRRRAVRDRRAGVALRHHPVRGRLVSRTRAAVATLRARSCC